MEVVVKISFYSGIKYKYFLIHQDNTIHTKILNQNLSEKKNEKSIKELITKITQSYL